MGVWLKDFGMVTLFRTTLKDQNRHYVVYLPEDMLFNATNLLKFMISTGRSNKMQMAQVFTNIYQHQNALFKDTVGAFVESFARGKGHLLPKFTSAINA